MVMRGKHTLMTIDYAHEKENTLVTIDYGHERNIVTHDQTLWSWKGKHYSDHGFMVMKRKK